MSLQLNMLCKWRVKQFLQLVPFEKLLSLKKKKSVKVCVVFEFDGSIAAPTLNKTYQSWLLQACTQQLPISSVQSLQTRALSFLLWLDFWPTLVFVLMRSMVLQLLFPWCRIIILSVRRLQVVMMCSGRVRSTGAVVTEVHLCVDVFSFNCS